MASRKKKAAPKKKKGPKRISWKGKKKGKK